MKNVLLAAVITPVFMDALNGCLRSFLNYPWVSFLILVVGAGLAAAFVELASEN